MKNFILQSLDGKINLSAKKGSAVGTFKNTQTEKPNQFANELSQLMETTSSYNVSKIENSQNEKLNTFLTSPDGKTFDSDLNQQKNPLLKAFDNRNIPLNNDSDLPEISLLQSKQNLLASTQSLFVDNTGYKAIAEDGKNDKLELALKSNVSIEDISQPTVNVSENIILSAMAQQLPTNIVPKQNPEPQDYKLDTTMEDKIKPLISNQNTIKMELKSEPLTDNSALSISPTQSITIKNQIKPVITDQNSIQIETKAEPLTDNNVPIIPTIPVIQKEVLKVNDEKIITNEKSMLQDEVKSKFQSKQKIDLSIQIQPIKSSDTKANLNQEKITDKFTAKISLDTQFLSTNNQNGIDTKYTKQENIQKPKEQGISDPRLFANQSYIEGNKVENYSVVSSDISTPEKVLLTSQSAKFKQDTIQKPIDSVKSTDSREQILPQVKQEQNIQADLRITGNADQKLSSDKPILTEEPINKPATNLPKKSLEGEHTNNLQFNTPTINKENKPIEQYEFRQNINPVQNPNVQIKLSSKQVYDRTPESYNPVDISALKASIMGSENGSASGIKQAELNGNDVSIEYAQVKPEQKTISKQTIFIDKFADNLTSKNSETIFENNNIPENKPIKQEQYAELTQKSLIQIRPESKQNSQKTSEVIDSTDKSNTKASEITTDRKNISFDNLIELRQNDITVQNKPLKIENESNQSLSQIKKDNTLENVSVIKSNKNDLQGISQVKHENNNELIQNTQTQVKPDVKIANHELSQADKIVNNSQIDIPINLSKDSKELVLSQVKQKQDVQADLRINGNVDQKINTNQSFLVDEPITSQTKQEQNIQTDSHINDNASQKLSSDKPILTEEPIGKPVTNLPKKSLENVIINNVNDKYEQDILPQPTSDKKASESKSDINQTFKTQIITNGLLFNKSGNKNTQDQQKSIINQTPAKDNQAQKTNNQKEFSVELDETRKYSTEKSNSPKLIENQNVKMDKGQQDNYMQEKPVQISSNSIVEQEKSTKSSLSKNSENSSYTTVSDTISKQDTKGSIFQETQQIGYERRLNTENNIQRSKVDNIEANNIITKDDVMKDKSSEIISPKIENVKEANTNDTVKFDIPLSRVNNDFVTTQINIKNIPVIDKNEMTSKVVELPDKITQYISTVKNDTKPQSVMIQLEPANLGKIKLKVSVKDNRLMVEMSVASFATKEIIEVQLPDIKRSLMQYDLQVSGFNVTLDNGSSKFGSYNPNSSQQGKWSSESWGNNRGDENNNNSHENTKRYMGYVNNESMVDILT
jgi:hypothetical protein